VYHYLVPPLKKKVLLIVEDEKTLAELLGKTFSMEGFDVLRARDGVEALSVALANHPDVILLDILLPGMDGIGMLEKLREYEWGKHAKVIVLTNLSPDDHIMDEIAEEMPAYYIVKANTSMEDIVAKVRELVGQE
jgi:DNA-binding response OmpR family regulator